jgi:hypothetical protein
MAKPKEHFDFDAFINKIDTALLLAQKTAVLIDKDDDTNSTSKTAKSAVSKLREIRQMISEPLVWFKMEKGLYYRKDPGKNWKCLGEKNLP